jgi:3-isopropylmalate/(R)-2-methylmalate dehydratase small subunit
MIITGSLLAIDRANIDTDQIIPARFLTGITKSGLGQHLFRGLGGGPELLASHPGAVILATRENFGCGSSREHAAWALLDWGFRAVIAPSFARIFQENAYNNGLVPVLLKAEGVDAVFASPGELTIDVVQERLTLGNGAVLEFQLDPLRKEFILGGGFLRYLQGKIPQIRAWEAARETAP